MEPVVKRRSFWQFYAVPVAIMLLAYLVPMVTGATVVRAGYPWATKMREEVVRQVDKAAPIAAATRDIQAGRYVRAGLIVFLWNFVMGAVVMSTLVGGVFFLLPPVVALLRGMGLGLLYDPAIFQGAHGITVMVTGALELPNYMIAGALGMRLGLAWLMPPRRERLREVCEQAKFSLPAVALMLLLAAIWEVGGIVYLMRHP